jgi:tetratricopeptide (TPR) repeat protein
LARERDQALNRFARATNATPRLPAPKVPASSPGETVADFSPTNFLSQMREGETPKLTSEQIEAYLKENHRNAASLLAVARVSGDKSFLKEAMEKFPDDPRVAFDAVFLNSEATAEERRQWVEKFKQNAPDNALASYVSALDYFKSGQSDQAVQELVAASAKSQFQDYFWDQVQNAEEAWRASGYSELDARWLGVSQRQLPHLTQLKQLNQNIVDLANAYRQAGDVASAQAALQYDIQLGERLAQFPNDPLITHLVGFAIQRNALGALDPNDPYGATGLTVADQMEQIKQRREAIKDLNQQVEPLFPLLSQQDFITWADRRRAYGDLNAMQWIINKHGRTTTGSP